MLGQSLPLSANLYENELEAALFSGKAAHQQDALALFLASSSKFDAQSLDLAREQLAGIWEELAAQLPRKANETRKADLLYRGLRKRMFKHYSYIAKVSETLDNGVFNCVSSTAIMALTLQHFGFEYDIQRLPQHVFLYAKADGHWLRIETTSRDIGVVREKRTSNVETYALGRQSGARQQGQSTSLMQLAAWQYYNDGLLKMDGLATLEAYKAFCKAALIDQAPEIASMKQTALAQLQVEAMTALKEGNSVQAMQQLILPMQEEASGGKTQEIFLAACLAYVEGISDLEAALVTLDQVAARFPDLSHKPSFSAAKADRQLALSLVQPEKQIEILSKFSADMQSQPAPFDLQLAEKAFESAIQAARQSDGQAQVKQLLQAYGKAKLARINI